MPEVLLIKPVLHVIFCSVKHGPLFVQNILVLHTSTTNTQLLLFFNLTAGSRAKTAPIRCHGNPVCGGGSWDHHSGEACLVRRELPGSHRADFGQNSLREQQTDVQPRQVRVLVWTDPLWRVKCFISVFCWHFSRKYSAWHASLLTFFFPFLS